MGVLGLFLLGSCNSKSEHDHEGHSHETEKAHNHDHEGHDHEHEEHDHASENHEGHNHEAEMAAGHSDEIILAPEKAKAAGVESEIIQPKSFRQVITTSGQVQAARRYAKPSQRLSASKGPREPILPRRNGYYRSDGFPSDRSC